jgi:hypothetical protein
MPLHDYIRQIYQEAGDSAYIIRFLYFVIGKYVKRVEFLAGDHKAEPLITGILENVKTKERYYSLADFYTKATGNPISMTDISIFKKVNVTQSYSVWRMVCNVKEHQILEFFDQKYRAFLMYRDIRSRVRAYANFDTEKEIKLLHNDTEFTLTHSSLDCKYGSEKSLELLEEFENGTVEELYYRGRDGQYLISV